MRSPTVNRDQLRSADLTIDAVYQGGRAGNAGDDPLSHILGVSNQGGFRHLGRRDAPHLLVLTSSMNEPDWPDRLDIETGLFTYYGDNRSPGRELHGTPRWGNRMLRDLFSKAHSSAGSRSEVCPVLVFRNAGVYRDVVFLGLAVPGGAGIPPTEDLVVVWRHSRRQRFQNYMATLTILDVPVVSRAWLDDIRNGDPRTGNAPSEWLRWTDGAQAKPLRSSTVLSFRTRDEQMPALGPDARMLSAIYERFRSDPYEFEECAAQIAEMLLPGIVDRDLTRRSRDGGRDAIGRYRIGSGAHGIKVDFALEAKCFGSRNPVGVKETSRLISRLRHRQFGILVTTSFVARQAYEEIIDDEHPILIISGRDIVETLKRAGIRDEKAARTWLDARFGQLAARSV